MSYDVLSTNEEMHVGEATVCYLREPNGCGDSVHIRQKEKHDKKNTFPK